MTMVRFLLALLVGMSLHLVCSAQNDTIRAQDLRPPAKKGNKTDTVTRKPHVHSPRRATLYSTFFPGLGQFYNRKYWKIPIVWAAVGIPAYTYFDNKSWYQKCQHAIALLDHYNQLGITFPADSLKYVDPKLQVFMTSNDENSLRTYRNEFRKNEDYSILFFILFWGLNVADATVDAHLKSFDVSNSLTLRLDQPSGNATLPGPAGPGMGFSVVVDWHKPRFKPMLLQ